MIVKVGKNETYEVNFNHNTADKVGAVVIRKNDRFLTVGNATCGAKESYCKDCSRKKALANAFKNVGLATIPKELRWQFWETYRVTLVDPNHKDAEGKVIPKWPQSPLKRGTKEMEESKMRAELKKLTSDVRTMRNQVETMSKSETKKEFSRVVAKGNAAYAKVKASKK